MDLEIYLEVLPGKKSPGHVCLGIHLKTAFHSGFQITLNAEVQLFTHHQYQHELGEINST